jgi:hypothetical protein
MFEAIYKIEKHEKKIKNDGHAECILFQLKRWFVKMKKGLKTDND